MSNENTPALWRTSEEHDRVLTAWMAALGEFENPDFDSFNPHFKNKYASLGQVLKTIKPVLEKHQLVHCQWLGSIDGLTAVETVFMHKPSNQWLSVLTTLPSGQANPQGYGSAASYGRRYALLAATGTVGENDDDGNAASGVKATKAKQTTQKPEDSKAIQDSTPTVALLFGRGKKYQGFDGKETAAWVKEVYKTYPSGLTDAQLSAACEEIKVWKKVEAPANA